MNKYLLLNERLHLRSPNINVCFRLVIEGIIDKLNIEESIKNVSKKHPFVNSSIEIDNNNDAWLIGNEKPINIEYYKSSEIEWQEWYKNIDNIPFNFLKGPLVKICIISGENTEIIILGHHIISDGVGYLNLVKDLLSALDNKNDFSLQIPPTKLEDKYFKQTFLLEQQTKDYTRWLNSEWRKNKISFSEKDFNIFFEQYRKTFISNFYTASLEGSNLKKLLEKSKSTGLTVNEIIASAFSLTLMEKLDRKDIRLGVAANIRNEIVSEPNHCMGNYVTGISENVEYSPENNLMENIKLISMKLRSQLSNMKTRHLPIHFLNEFDKDLIEVIMPAVYGKVNNPIAKKIGELIGEKPESKALGISNLGKHNFDNYSNINVIDLQFIGPVFPANLLTVDFITVNDKLNFCLRYNENEINTDTVKEIYKKTIELFI